MLVPKAEYIDGWSHTPILTLVRKNRTIVLCGMVHMGTPHYYHTINATLDIWRRTGWKVAYEGIEKVPENGEVGSGDPACIYLRHIEDLVRILFVREPVGLVFQSDYITYHPEDVCIDLPYDQIKKKLGDIIEGDCQPLSFEEALKISKKYPNRMAAHLLRNVFSTAVSVDESLSGVVDGMREGFAAAEILKEADRANIAGVWGSGHIQGLSKYLLEAGFEITKLQWLPSIPVDPLFDLLIQHLEPEEEAAPS